MFTESSKLVLTIGALAFNMLPLSLVFLHQFASREQGLGDSWKRMKWVLRSLFWMIGICLVSCGLILLQETFAFLQQVAGCGWWVSDLLDSVVKDRVWGVFQAILLGGQIIWGIVFLRSAWRICKKDLLP